MRSPIALPATLALLGLHVAPPAASAQQTTLVDAAFDSASHGFTYQDDAFRGTDAPAYASGTRGTTADGRNALIVELGGRDYADVFGMSGGWQRELVLEADAEVSVTLEYNLAQTGSYESDEVSEALVAVDTALVGVAGTDFVDSVRGDGNWGSSIETGWQSVELDLGTLGAGVHELVIGAFNNKKTYWNESTQLAIGRVLITATVGSPSEGGSPSEPQPSTGRFTVELLDRPVGFQTVPFDMNDRGEAVGYYLDGQLNYRAILWDAEGNPSNLAGDGTWSQAHGIAEDGRICGYYGPSLQSVEPTVWTDAGPQTLELARAVPGDIASSGHAVGSLVSASGTREIAFWEGARAIAPTGELPGVAASINEWGEAVGQVSIDGFPRAAYWDAGGGLTLLPGVQGAPTRAAHAISDSGLILGTAHVDDVTRPVVWSGPHAAPVVLERFEGTSGVAKDVNDAGWAVGVDRLDEYNGTGRALLWDEGGTPMDLNTLIDPDSGWTLIDAVSVNDVGQILGRGFYSGASGQVAFRLTPTTEP